MRAGLALALGALACQVALAASSSSPVLVGPYLQAGTDTSVTVMWRLGYPAACRLDVYSDAGKPVLTRDSSPGLQHAVRLAGLRPATAYAYVVRQAERELGRGTFRTLPDAPGSRLRFAVLGDSGSGAPQQFAVADALEAWKPDFVLHTGDVIYEGGEAENYAGRFWLPYHRLLSRCVVYPSIGNHDQRTDSAGPYLAFFEVPRAHPAETERWYQFRAGLAEFFALDTNSPFAPGSTQYRWLQAALRNSAARWKFAFFHHPPYSGGAHGSSLYVRQALGPLFERHDVEIVFSGHDHHYERSRSLEDFVPDGRPTTYFVTGGGGAWLRRAAAQPHSAYVRPVYHFLGVNLTDDEVEVAAIDTQGRTFDSFRVRR